MKRNPIYPLISICFLILLAYSVFGPHIKYPAGRDTVESFGDGSFQVLRGEGKGLFSEKYNNCLIDNVEFVRRHRGKAYVTGTGLAKYQMCAVIDTAANTIQLCAILPDPAVPNLHILRLDEMVANGDAVIYTSLDDFSEEDRLVFQKMQTSH